MVTLTSRFERHVTFRRREPPLTAVDPLTAIGADPPIRRGTLERHRTPSDVAIETSSEPAVGQYHSTAASTVAWATLLAAVTPVT